MSIIRQAVKVVIGLDGEIESEEAFEVDVTEEVRSEAIRTKARAIITRLKEIEAQAANRPDATNLAQANTQLQGLADAVSDLSKVLRHVVVLNVVPDLLADDNASSDLDT